MSRPKKTPVGKAPLTDRQQRIRAIQGIPRGDRDGETIAELARLQSEERRDRWTRLFPKRVERLKVCVRNIARMGNPQSYQYDADEAAALIAAIKSYATEIERAFRGTPKEKGLFDL